MPPTIRIDVFGDTLIHREIAGRADRAGNMNPVFKSIFDRMMEINAEQFRSAGVRGGTPWAPLKEATVLAKARKGLDPDIEFATHALFEALTSPSSGDNEFIFNEDWAHFMVTGDPAIYGPSQHRGDPDRGLPSRPLLVLTELDKSEMVDEMARYVFTGELGSFL